MPVSFVDDECPFDGQNLADGGREELDPDSDLYIFGPGRDYDAFGPFDSRDEDYISAP